MPHPTPPSKQFEAIRNAFPAVFDCPSCKSRQLKPVGAPVSAASHPETIYRCAKCEFEQAVMAGDAPQGGEAGGDTARSA